MSGRRLRAAITIIGIGLFPPLPRLILAATQIRAQRLGEALLFLLVLAVRLTQDIASSSSIMLSIRPSP